MTTILINHEHIKILKQHRFFAIQPHLLAQIERKDDTVGWIKVDSKLHFKGSISIEPYSAIYAGGYRGSKGAGKSSGLCSIGAMSYSHSPLPEKMEIGRYCSIGDGLKVLDSHHPLSNISTSHFTWRANSPAVAAACRDKGVKLPKQPNFPINGYKPFPKIQNDVWIGQNVTLSMGIEIGNGAVVAANSVVTKSVPDYAIVGGNPAKVLKYRFTERQVTELKEIRWWEYLFTDFSHFNFQCMDTFITQWREEGSTLKPYEPRTLRFPEDFKI